MVGSLCKNQPTQSEPIPEVKTPTTPSTPYTPNSYMLLQKQLLLQQQMLMTQMMMNQLILSNSPTMIQSAPPGTNINSNIFSPTTATPLSPFSASAFQPNQNIFNTETVKSPTPKPSSSTQSESVTVQEEPAQNVQETPEPQQEQPPQEQIPQAQILIDDHQNPQQNENAYDYIYTFGKVLLVSTVVFAKEGWVTWFFCTIGFYLAILLLKYLNNVIHSRVVRDQERREREVQERVNNGAEAEPESVIDSEPVTDRGVFGTLGHIVYLFFISLAPTYQPRRRVAVEEEHEE